MKRIALLALLIALLLPITPVTAFRSPLKRGVGYSTHEDPAQASIDAMVELRADMRTWGHYSGPDWVVPLNTAGLSYYSSVWKPLTSTSFLQQLQAEAVTNPNSVWLYGNEPELMGVTPEEAAAAYPAIRDAIREVDPDAEFVACNVLWGYYGPDWCKRFALSLADTEGIAGLGVHLYLDLMHYSAPYDVCPSENVVVAEFSTELDEAWDMSERYFGGVPLYITEIGQLRDVRQIPGCQFHEAMVTRVLPQLDRDPRVVKYFWFASMADSQNDPSGDDTWCWGCQGSLLTDDLAGLSELGRLYRDFWPRSYIPIGGLR